MAYSVISKSFYGLCAGLAFVGVALGFFQFLRFAAIDVAPKELASKAISWVLAGGLIAAFIGPSVASLTRMQMPEFPFAVSYMVLIPFGLLLLLFIKNMALPMPTVEE